MDRVIGIGEYWISPNKEDVLKTYALASCVAVTCYSPEKKIAGMVHVGLPHPLSEKEARTRPGYYASTGVPLLIDLMCKGYGCLKEELQIRLYGGAQSVKKDDYFKIGQQNAEAIYKILSHMKLTVHYSEVGGTLSRTLEMKVATGNVKVFTQPITV